MSFIFRFLYELSHIGTKNNRFISSSSHHSIVFLLNSAFPRRTSLTSTQFPKSHRCRCCHVQRIDSVRHGNAYHVVGFGYPRRRKPVAFVTHYNGQPRLRCQDRIVNGNGFVRKSHCSRAKAEICKSAERAVHPSPRNKKNGTHRHSDDTTVEGIASVTRKQHAIHADSGCRAEDGTYISAVRHSVDDNDTAGFASNLRKAGQSRPAHGTKHSSRQDISRETGKQFSFAGIDRHIGATFDNRGRITIDMSALT